MQTHNLDFEPQSSPLDASLMADLVAQTEPSHTLSRSGIRPAPSGPRQRSASDVEALKEFGQAALYSGIAEPVLGVAQIGAEINGRRSWQEAPQELARIGLRAPDQGQGTLCRDSRMLGSAVGMMLPYLALHKAFGCAANAVSGEEAATAVGLGLSGGASFTRVLAKEAVVSFASGFTLDTFFKPSDGGKGILALSKTRVENGLSGGTTMAVLSGTSLSLGQLGASAALKNTLGAVVLRNPMTAGLISAVPAGLVQAEATTLQKGGWRPDPNLVKANIDQMVFVGLTLGGARAVGLMGGSTTNGKSASQVERGGGSDAGRESGSAQAASQETRGGDEQTSSQDKGPAAGQGQALEAGTFGATEAQGSHTLAEDLLVKPIVNLESPTARAERLGLPKDMERSKALLFGQIEQPGGDHTDVVVRPFKSGANSNLRVYRANLAERLGDTIKSETGIESLALPMVVRDNFTLPDMTKEVFDWSKTTTEPVIVQENGGKQLGTQLREWAFEKTGQSAAGDLPTGAITDLIEGNSDIKALVGRAAFDNMFKGNIDLVEFSQQTIKKGTGSQSLNPADQLKLKAVDNKNDFTLLPEPSWGFGSQFGLTLEVAKALEGKTLDQVTPGLQGEAESLERLFTSETGKQKLVAAGQTTEETSAAASRLRSLIDHGFPKHLGESNHYADEAKTKLTASLTGAYDKEMELAGKYLESRDQNLTVKVLDGRFVIVKGD